MSLFSFDFNSESSARGGFASIGVMVAAVVIIGGGVFAYTQFGGNGNNGSGTSSATPSLSDITAAHQEVTSFQHETTVSAQANLNPTQLSNRDDAQQLRQTMQFVPNVSAQEEFPSVVNASFSMSGNASVATTTYADTQSQFSVSIGEESASEILSVEYRRTEGENYVRGGTLPSIGFFNLSPYEGQWFSFAAEEATSQVPGSFQVSGFMSGLQEDLPEDTSLSQETIRELIAAMQEEGVISFANVTEDQLADGTAVYRMDVSFDSSAVSSYAQEAKAIVQESNPELANSEAFQMSSQEMQELKESIQKANEQFDTMRIWVGQDTNYLRQVELVSDINASEIKNFAQQQDKNTQGFKDARISVDVALSAYNEPVDVTAPENATPFSEAFGSGQQSQSGLMQ